MLKLQTPPDRSFLSPSTTSVIFRQVFPVGRFRHTDVIFEYYNNTRQERPVVNGIHNLIVYMSERKFSFVPGEYYHIYNRGNSKQNIFFDTHDYVRFQRMLFLCNGRLPIKIDSIRNSKTHFYNFKQDSPLVAIGAYVLMPNHFHVLLTPLVEQGASMFMRKLTTGYSMYFNKRNERTGALFEGKFKAQYVDDDVYLKYLYAYIHMNPLKLINPMWKEKGVDSEEKSYLETYPYSSLRSYLGTHSKESKILNTSPFPEYFTSADSMRVSMYEWFSDRKDLS